MPSWQCIYWETIHQRPKQVAIHHQRRRPMLRRQLPTPLPSLPPPPLRLLLLLGLLPRPPARASHGGGCFKLCFCILASVSLPRAKPFRPLAWPARQMEALLLLLLPKLVRRRLLLALLLRLPLLCLPRALLPPLLPLLLILALSLEQQLQPRGALPLRRPLPAKQWLLLPLLLRRLRCRLLPPPRRLLCLPPLLVLLQAGSTAPLLSIKTVECVQLGAL